MNIQKGNCFECVNSFANLKKFQNTKRQFNDEINSAYAKIRYMYN